MGFHEHQEPSLPRCDVHRGVNRSGYGQHHAAANAGGLPGSRKGAQQPRRGPPGAAKALAGLEALGISLDEVTYELEVDGVKSFAESVTVLLDAIKAKTAMPM